MTKIYLRDLPRDKNIIIHYGELPVIFHRIDGLFSYCTVAEGKSKGEPFHLSGNTPLLKVKEGEYKVDL